MSAAYAKFYAAVDQCLGLLKTVCNDEINNTYCFYNMSTLMNDAFQCFYGAALELKEAIEACGIIMTWNQWCAIMHDVCVNICLTIHGFHTNPFNKAYYPETCVGGCDSADQDCWPSAQPEFLFPEVFAQLQMQQLI